VLVSKPHRLKQFWEIFQKVASYFCEIAGNLY